MRIRLFTSILLFFSLAASAQTKVEVLDSERKGLPHAHIIFKGLGEDQKEMVLTDQFGKAEIPSEFCKNNPVFTVSISYIGFKNIENDTVKAGKTLRFILKDDEVTLNQLVVTAQYSPNSPEKSVHKISIINSEKIETMAAVTLTDVLNNELNMSISEDNILGSQLSIQGLGGENVKILVDGVPMIGRTSGNIDLNQINLENIERIEVVEGPMSVNYGTNALAGAINLITKKGSQQRWQGNVHAYTQSTGKYNLNANVNYSQGKHSLGLSGGRNYFDGWNPGDKHWDRSDQIADSTRAKQWNPKEQYLLNFQYGYQYNLWNFRFKSDYFDETITNKGTPYDIYQEEAFDDYYMTTRFDNSVFADGNFSENFRGNFILAYNTFTRIKNTYKVDLTDLSQVLNDNPEDQDTSRFNQWTMRGSVANVNAMANINYEIGYDFNLEEGEGRRIEDGLQKQQDYALYASAEYRPWSNTIIRPGLRYAYNTNFNSPLIPSLNVKQDFGKYAIRASYALGFRAPSLKEQYFDFNDSNHNINGNPNLEAENSNNFNISAQYTNVLTNALYKFEVSGFYNVIQDMITLAQLNTVEWSYVNVDTYKTTGINMNIQMNVYHFKINLGGSYIGRYNQFDEYSADSTAFYWSPEARFNLAYEFRKLGLTAAFFIKYQGKLPIVTGDLDSQSQGFVEAYPWGDFTLSQRLWGGRINLSAGIKNIFDIQSVNTSTSSSGGIHSGSGDSQSVGTGRSMFVSLKYNFKSKK